MYIDDWTTFTGPAAIVDEYQAAGYRASQCLQGLRADLEANNSTAQRYAGLEALNSIL